MSILIKGAKMPKTCEECQSTLGLFAKECPLFAEFPKEFDYDPEIGNNRRYANCPLVEVLEPHGRLIDCEELCKKINFMYDIAIDQKDEAAIKILRDIIIPMIVSTPTVIEAEGENESKVLY